MTVEENIGFGLKMRKLDKQLVHRRVCDMLELVHLPDLGKRRPSELSGGQQQRVALARALIVNPDVLLLDEPLSNLDAHLRVEMRDLIRSLQQELKITTVFVTHDQEEAVVMADKIALIIEGNMTQYDKPELFFQRPADIATARFFGGRNFIGGTSSGGNFDCALGSLQLPAEAKTGEGTLTFRPENVLINAPEAHPNSVKTTLIRRTYLGTQTRLVLATETEKIEALCSPGLGAELEPGISLNVAIPTHSLWVL